METVRAAVLHTQDEQRCGFGLGSSRQAAYARRNLGSEPKLLTLKCISQSLQGARTPTGAVSLSEMLVVWPGARQAKQEQCRKAETRWAGLDQNGTGHA